MLNLIFSIRADRKIKQKQICVGNFKKQIQCFVFASDSGKVNLIIKSLEIVKNKTKQHIFVKIVIEKLP